MVINLSCQSLYSSRIQILIDIANYDGISTRELVCKKRTNTRHHISGLRDKGLIERQQKGTKSGDHRWSITKKGLGLLSQLEKQR